MSSTAKATADAQLVDDVSQFLVDPLGFVLWAYPWGEKGTTLEHYDGPDVWQERFLRSVGEEVERNAFDGHTPLMPIRRAVASGHGPGKTTMAAWLTDWIMSTRPMCRGTVTAQKWDQLRDKTWAAVKNWTAMCLTGHWFEWNDSRLFHRDHRDKWFTSPANAKEDNAQSFAGQHAPDSTSFYIFDEDSEIDDEIHRVAEGGLIDGEPMVFLFGNPTRRSGHFYRACFGAERDRWHAISLDARESKLTNKALIAEWLETYGEDSDFFRVRVKGLPPNAEEIQYIPTDRVHAAQKRQVVVMADEPLVAGVDFAWGGSDDNVVRFRCGLDARTIPSMRVKGEFTRDPSIMVTRLAEVLSGARDGRQVAMLFMDSAGIAGPVAARLRALGFGDRLQEVNFGAHSPDVKFRFFRDCMWGRMKEWLLAGAIDSHPELEVDLTGPGTRPDASQRVWLESKEDMKKRKVDSPDDGDALALTFAAPVAVRRQSRRREPKPWQWA